jgi:hypothetical protein
MFFEHAINIIVCATRLALDSLSATLSRVVVFVNSIHLADDMLVS